MQSKITYVIPLALCLSGCGFSKSYWEEDLQSKSILEICAASLETRGGYFAIKKEAALSVINSNQIKCDREKAYELMSKQRAKAQGSMQMVCTAGYQGIVFCY